MKTLSLLVEIDGERFAVSGSDDWGVLNVVVTAVRANPKLRSPEDSIEVTVGGICEQTTPGEHHGMRWGNRTLGLGSKVCVTVVSTAQRDDPIKRYRFDSTVQESAFTDDEWREMWYRDYLALRREFDPDA
jgi:hypothetical protein